MTIIVSVIIKKSKNNNNLFEKQQNEWFVPQIVTKLIEAGQDEYRNTLKKKITRTYKYKHAKTLRSNRFKAFETSLQNKSNNTKWNNYLVSPTYLIIIRISI